MTVEDTTDVNAARLQVVRELRELVAALDRRLPQVERVGEIAIARAAAALRAEAVKRLETFEREADVRSRQNG